MFSACGNGTKVHMFCKIKCSAKGCRYLKVIIILQYIHCNILLIKTLLCFKAFKVISREPNYALTVFNTLLSYQKTDIEKTLIRKKITLSINSNNFITESTKSYVTNESQALVTYFSPQEIFVNFIIEETTPKTAVL